MKFRKGFVSNSSSSSFIILKDNLSEEQIDQIYNHQEYAEKNFPQLEYTDWGWDVLEETEIAIKVYTDMANFNMYEYLLLIGVKEDDIDKTGANR